MGDGLSANAVAYTSPELSSSDSQLSDERLEVERVVVFGAEEGLVEVDEALSESFLKHLYLG